MGKIRVLSDNLANQIAAGEVVERPASVAKELLENSLDAGATRIAVEIEAGGRRLLKITDDGDGMTRDDAVLAFERHATSKIRTFEDLNALATLGFRGEALASIASVARVELVTKTKDEAAATRVVIEGGRLVDVKDAAHPTGTTLAVRDLFFNVPARRKFLRSEATENFHLINLVTHYALAHPDKAFSLTNNGREAMRVTPARTLRERAFQIFGGDFIESLLTVGGGREFVAKISGFVSAPRERRTSRDAQYFFINGRFVRDKIIGRALSEGYRSVLPHGVYPVALLFVEIPPEEVDVNVHPAKTEVRFRRPEAVREVITETIRGALAAAGIVALEEGEKGRKGEGEISGGADALALSNQEPDAFAPSLASPLDSLPRQNQSFAFSGADEAAQSFAAPLPDFETNAPPAPAAPQQQPIDFINAPPSFDAHAPSFDALADEAAGDFQTPSAPFKSADIRRFETNANVIEDWAQKIEAEHPTSDIRNPTSAVPPLDSAAKLVKPAEIENLSASGIRPLGQLHRSYIIATDAEGLLLVDQHVAHERILFDKFRAKVGARRIESQNLLLPETIDLTPAQAAAFESVQADLEDCGFSLMRFSGRTVAIKGVPSDLPASEARNLLREILDTVDAEKRGAARDTWRDSIAASLACRAAVKINMPLTMEKMQWLIDQVLTTDSPTTCPHGRPVILRLTMKDIERGFHRT